MVHLALILEYVCFTSWLCSCFLIVQSRWLNLSKCFKWRTSWWGNEDDTLWSFHKYLHFLRYHYLFVFWRWPLTYEYSEYRYLLLALFISNSHKQPHIAITYINVLRDLLRKLVGRQYFDINYNSMLQ